jgi:hypothetical protein
MQIQNGLADLQGGSGVSGHPGGSQVQHGMREMVGHVPVPHPAVHSKGQAGVLYRYTLAQEKRLAKQGQLWGLRVYKKYNHIV